MVGVMTGVEGVFVRRQETGRILIHLQNGLFVEIYEYCIEPIDET